jgi:hypothetical protein
MIETIERSPKPVSGSEYTSPVNRMEKADPATSTAA